MKRIFYLIALLLAASCSRDLDPSFSPQNGTEGSHKILNQAEHAIAGMLAIKVDPAQSEEITRNATRSGGSRSGVASIDRGLEALPGARITRLFCDPAFEDRLQAAGLDCWYRLTFLKESNLKEAAHRMAAAEGVVAVQYLYPLKHPRRQLRAISEAPGSDAARNSSLPTNDQGLYRQWNYHNDGTISGAVAGADINLFDAWAIEKGDSRIIVAVLDEPMQLTHPDLAGNLWVNTTDTEEYLRHGGNFCTTTETPISIDWEYRDEYGDKPSHGSHVAGIVGAVSNNNEGIAGIAGGDSSTRGVSLMCCQIFDYDSYGQDTSTPDAAAKAMVWAANRGAHIAQCSYGFGPDCTEEYWASEDGYGFEKEAIDYFISTPRAEGPLNGGLVIFAAGNDGNSLYRNRQVKDQRLAPGCYSPTIAVAATSPDFTPAGYTSYGNWVDISAPGGDVDNFENEGMIYSLLNDSGYGYMEGTSMACPHVSGVAALGLSYALDLGRRYTAEEYRSLLLSATRSIDSYLSGAKITYGFNYSDYQYDEVRIFLVDYQNKMGGGQVDAFRLLMSIEETPVVTIPCNEDFEVDLGLFFGGAAQNSRFSFTLSDSLEAEERLQMRALIDGTKLRINCAKRGCATIGVKATVGESVVEHRLALIARSYRSESGGWL